MRSITLAVAALAAASMIAACSGGATDEAAKPEPKSAREIMKDYTETLSSAPKKAQEVRTQVETRSTDALKELE